MVITVVAAAVAARIAVVVAIAVVAAAWGSRRRTLPKFVARGRLGLAHAHSLSYACRVAQGCTVPNATTLRAGSTCGICRR